jgi:hypothetical protein
MAEHRTFNGFFSYAHHDAEIDPSLITDFTSQLEGRVGSKLTNARFAIWRDKEGLRTGARWNEKIETELRRADVLILLLYAAVDRIGLLPEGVYRFRGSRSITRDRRVRCPDSSAAHFSTGKAFHA